MSGCVRINFEVFWDNSGSYRTVGMNPEVPLCSGARLEELGMFSWRRESSRGNFQHIPGPKETPGEAGIWEKSGGTGHRECCRTQMKLPMTCPVQPGAVCL